MCSVLCQFSFMSRHHRSFAMRKIDHSVKILPDKKNPLIIVSIKEYMFHCSKFG